MSPTLVRRRKAARWLKRAPRPSDRTLAEAPRVECVYEGPTGSQPGTDALVCRFSNGDNELLRLAIESSRQPDDVIRQWCAKFGPDYARRLKRRHGRLGDTWFLDEVLVTINGQRQYLWRAVDQDGDLIDLLVQPRRDGRAARRFFRENC